MRTSGYRTAARAGVTLVEVMLAGAMTAIAVLATLEGTIVAAKIAHENAETLHADGVAFDYIWNVFNHEYGDFDGTVISNVTLTVSASNDVLKLIKCEYTVHNQTHTLEVLRSNIPEERKFASETEDH